MSEIKLTKGKYALVDDEDFDYLNQFKWYTSTAGYARRYSRDINTKKSKYIYMHRELNNTPLGLSTDHINGDTLDNRKCNLRSCTHEQNMLNSGKHGPGYKGISWAVKSNKWDVRITIKRKCVRLGFFSSLEEAIMVYNNAAIKHHGEFARLNEIGGHLES